MFVCVSHTFKNGSKNGKIMVTLFSDLHRVYPSRVLRIERERREFIRREGGTPNDLTGGTGESNN
jgi:hypothetical protein